MMSPFIPKASPWKKIWFFFFQPLALRDIQEWMEYNKKESYKNRTKEAI